MTLRVCATCSGEGLICPKCRKPWGYTGNRTAFGMHRNKHCRNAGGCGLKRGDALKCPEHTESFFECDLGGERAPGAQRPADWTHERIPGQKPGTSLIDACPSCLGALRVGWDFALRVIGDDSGSLIESIACAWAFHVGQYEDAARKLQWDLDQGGAKADWRAPDYIAPATLGRYGWGRWTQVRREAEGGIEVPREFAEAIQAGGVLRSAWRPVSLSPLGTTIDQSIIDEGTEP